jgi:hypothetical protein
MSTHNEIDDQFTVIPPEPDPIGDQIRLLRQAVEQLGTAIYDWRVSLGAALDRATLDNPVSVASIAGSRRQHHSSPQLPADYWPQPIDNGSMTCMGIG